MRDRRAASLALEGVVIVVSILAAFLLDAWWDGRKLRSQLDQELTSVAREVDANRGLVAYEISALERHVAAGEAVLGLLEGASPTDMVPVPDTLAWFVALPPTLDVSSGALDGLIASGRLAQIQDPKMRLDLAAFRGRVDDAVGDELLAQDILMRQVYPAVSQFVDFSAVYLIDNEFFAGPHEIDRAAPTYGGAVMLPGSPQARNAILYRTSWLASALGEMRGLLAGVDSLQATIAAGREG